MPDHEALRGALQPHTQFAEILEATSDYVATADLEGRTLFMNRSGRRMIGLAEDEDVYGKPIGDKYTDWARRVVLEEGIPAALRDGVWSGETAFALPGGREMPLSQVIIAHRDENGEAAYLSTIARDITERSRAEEALRQAEERYRSIFESTGDAIFVFDYGGNVVETNPAACAMHGYAPDEMVGLHGTDVIHPEDHHKFADFVERVRSGKDFHVEGRHVRKDGDLIDVEVTGTSFVFGGGPHLLAVVKDVTESMKAEAEIRTRARQQEAVADLGRHALAGMAVSELMDRAVKLLSRNLDVEYCKVLELLPGGEELLLRAGVGWQEGLVGRAKVGAHLDSQAGYTLDSGEPVVSEDLGSETRFSGPPLLHGHGVVSGMSTPIRGYERPYGVLGVHTARHRRFSDDDVNFLRSMANVLAEAIERKRAEEELGRQAELINLAYDAILVRAMDGTISYWNRGAQETYGYSGGEALGRVVHELLGTSEVSRRAVEAGLQGEGRWQGELEHTKPDGTPVQVESRQLVVSMEKEGTVLEINRDITERKRAERALEEVREAERHRIARDLHDGALQDISHAVVELDLLRLVPADEDRESRLVWTVEILRRSVRGLRAAVYALHLEGEYDVPLQDLLGAVAERNRQMARDQEIELEWQEGLPTMPLGEPGKALLPIVQEALTNARRHSGAGRVVVSVRREEDALLVDVSDDGRGFGDDAVPGIGSRSMRERASILGGDLRVESAPGEGTRVCLRVPLASLPDRDA